jgi:predicted dehydrogenase
MEKIRYGVIGLNGIGRHHLRMARNNPRIELTAVADLKQDLVKAKAEELDLRGFTDYRDMLDAGIVDAVSIATPHYTNSIIALECLKAGVHVYVEKPFALKVSEADEMLATARKNNLKICVGFQYRTFRSPRVMKDLITSGAIGDIKRVLWTWGEFRPEGYYARDVWRETYRHAGGGVLMNQASHDLDLMAWMNGKPVQVSALLGNQMHKAEIEDIATASILFANGAFGSFQSTINQPKGYSVRQIVGDKGIIVVPDVMSLTRDREDKIMLGTYNGVLSSLVTELPGDHTQPDVVWREVLSGEMPFWRKLFNPKKICQKLGLLEKIKPVNGIMVLMDSLVDSILNGGEPMVTGESARTTVELINAIILSAVRKKTVDLPLDPEEYDQVFGELCEQRVTIPRFH